MPQTFQGSLAASPGRWAVVVSRYNESITGRLLEGAIDCLVRHGADDDAITVVRVPGAYELPAAVQALCKGKHNAVIALGCVIRGDTRHYEHVADNCAQGLMRVALDHGIPVLNGVLAVELHADAQARAGGAHGNKGSEVALAALEMVDLLRKL